MSTDAGDETDQGTHGTPAGPTGEHALGHPLPAVVDWLAAAVVALTGAAFLVGGTVLGLVVDRDMLAEGIESGEITVVVFERDLTQAEMLEFTLDVVRWTGWGLLAAGLGLLAVAVWFVVVRHRARARAGPDEAVGTFWAHAVYGAVASAVLSFVPFSEAVGGGLSGYLDAYRGGNPTAAGAVSGLLAVVAPLVVLAGVTVGLFAGLSSVGESELGVLTSAAMVFVALLVVAYGAGLGALGGFVGGRLAHRDR